MFTNEFSNLLQIRNISAYSVAKATGISQGLMNEYKNGIKLPTIQNLVKIADCLGVSVDYLLGRTDVVEVNRGYYYPEEIAAYGAEGTKGEYITPPKETT